MQWPHEMASSILRGTAQPEGPWGRNHPSSYQGTYLRAIKLLSRNLLLFRLTSFLRFDYCEHCNLFLHTKCLIWRGFRMRFGALYREIPGWGWISTTSYYAVGLCIWVYMRLVRLLHISTANRTWRAETSPKQQLGITRQLSGMFMLTYKVQEDIIRY